MVAFCLCPLSIQDPASLAYPIKVSYKSNKHCFYECEREQWIPMDTYVTGDPELVDCH